MTAYGLARLTPGTINDEVLEYLERIDATLAPFGGRFLVHGGRTEVMEGEWSGHLIIIEFPDVATARAWYASPEYQAIIPLRARNLPGDLFLVEGVKAGHTGAGKADELRALATRTA